MPVWSIPGYIGKTQQGNEVISMAEKPVTSMSADAPKAEMPNAVAAAEMPKYKSTKVVHALKIAKIEPAGKIVFHEGKQLPRGATITPADEVYAPFDVDAAYVSKHTPKAGGYIVFYADGYKSWSPAEAFEAGYVRI